MIAAFLLAEIDSPRWGDVVKRRLAVFEFPESIIRRPDLESRFENRMRSVVLTSYRGWWINKWLFIDWPESLDWHRAVITPKDLPNIRYANTSDLLALTNGTLRPTEAGKKLLAGYKPGQSAADPSALFPAIKRGETFEPLIAIGTKGGNPIILVEGHTRLSAYSAVGFEKLNMIFGIGSRAEVESWAYAAPPKA